MTAREKFKTGDRVVASVKGIEWGIFGVVRLSKRLTGVVCGFGRDPHHVRVRREGDKASKKYHCSFWDVR